MQSNWDVHQAWKDHREDRGLCAQDVDKISEEHITDADRYILEAVKKSEGMPDEKRIRVLHNAVGYVLPFLTAHPVNKFDTEQERYESLSKKLVTAYKDWLEEACGGDPVSRKIMKGLKSLDFKGFGRDEWYDVMEFISYSLCHSEGYCDDVNKIYTTAQNLYMIGVYEAK